MIFKVSYNGLAVHTRRRVPDGLLPQAHATAIETESVRHRFVLRNSEVTVGGGAVLDPFPPIRINRDKTCARLRSLLTGSDGMRIRTLVEESTQGRKISNLVRTTGWTPERIKQLAKADETLTICETEQRVVSLVWLEQKRHQVTAWLQNFHQVNPASKGAAMHKVRSSLMSGIEPDSQRFDSARLPWNCRLGRHGFTLRSRSATKP